MSDARTAMPFPEIAARLKHALQSRLNAGDLGHVDAVVALARGGVVAGALAAYELGVPLRHLQLQFRFDDNKPRANTPVVTSEIPDVRGLRVLIVDDVSVSGATLRAARDALATDAVTLVLKGKPGAADIVLFDDVPECARWPWFEDVVA